MVYGNSIHLVTLYQYVLFNDSEANFFADVHVFSRFYIESYRLSGAAPYAERIIAWNGKYTIMEVFTMYINNEGKYGKYIIQESILPPFLATPEAKKGYYDVGRRRILWLDEKPLPNAA